MSRAVLISIRPEWGDKIIAGEKTVEIRKTRPNLGTPFKCYIYETQGKSDTPWIDEDGHMIFRGRGKVVGEFICDKIYDVAPLNHAPEDLEEQSCLTREEIAQYLNGKGYAWHITNARVFYPLPVELSKFTGAHLFGVRLELREIQRAPQSWCYVEELK